MKGQTLRIDDCPSIGAHRKALAMKVLVLAVGLAVVWPMSLLADEESKIIRFPNKGTRPITTRRLEGREILCRTTFGPAKSTSSIGRGAI